MQLLVISSQISLLLTLPSPNALSGLRILLTPCSLFDESLSPSPYPVYSSHLRLPWIKIVIAFLTCRVILRPCFVCRFRYMLLQYLIGQFLLFWLERFCFRNTHTIFRISLVCSLSLFFPFQELFCQWNCLAFQRGLLLVVHQFFFLLLSCCCSFLLTRLLCRWLLLIWLSHGYFFLCFQNRPDLGSPVIRLVRWIARFNPPPVAVFLNFKTVWLFWFLSIGLSCSRTHCSTS